MEQAKRQNLKRQITCICACLTITTTILAQQQTAINELLIEEGFEDIQTRMASDTLYAAIEDRAHRGTFRGAAAAIKKITEAHPEIINLEVMLTDYKMPQLIVHASKRGGKWDVSVDRKMERARKVLKGVKPQAASTGKIDITMFPLVSLTNNKLDHLFDFNVMIAPAFAATLWKGARLTIQPIIPLINNLQDVETTEKYIQLGNTNLRQQFLATRHWEASAAIGFFDIERAGLQASVTFHALRNLDIYLDGGYTWEANYTKAKGFGLTRDSQKFNFMAHASYYEHHTKLQVELQGGRFLYGDYGGRLDITRHFGEYAIGVYGILTGGENNAGFHFAIPIGGKRQKRSAFVRVRLPEYFSWTYSMQSYFKYWLEKMGRSFTTQPDENHSAHYWEPLYVQEYVSRLLNGSFK